MTRLARPDVRWRQSWAAAVAEFRGAPMHGSGLWDFNPLDLTEAGCQRVVEHLLAQEAPATDQPGDPDGPVPCTYFWIVDGGADSAAGGVGDGAGGPAFVGYLALRHRLNAWLLDQGGHIGYSVRPAQRGKGHATRALQQALPHAAALGLDRVLVTCDEDNEPSRRTIERAGGVLEDVRRGKRRYWVPTAT